MLFRSGSSSDFISIIGIDVIIVWAKIAKIPEITRVTGVLEPEM